MILLTGGTGYLGSRLVERLQAAGRRVFLFKRTDWERVEQILSDHRPSMIVHLATDYGRKGSAPEEISAANVELPSRLLDAAIAAKTPVFINADTLLGKEVSCYAYTKAQFRETLKSKAAALTVVNAAIEHFYGPGEDETKFVARMLRQLRAGVERIALSPGEQRRDFIYIDDVVEAFVLLIARAGALPKGFHPFEIGTGKTTSIRELLGLLVELTGNSKTRLDFGATPYRANETMEVRADIGALKALGWKPKISLKDGLRALLSGV